MGALLLYSLAFAVWFHPVVAHPGSRVACCVSDGTSTLRDLWVAGQQHDNPFYRASGLRPPRLDPGRFTLLERLGDVRIYGVHAPTVDLEAAIEKRQPEIGAIQGVVLPVPTVSLAGGFNAEEPYAGGTGAWMIQDGGLRVENHDVVPLRVVLDTVAFSNGQPRVLELEDGGGHVVARRTVPAYATRVELGPVEVEPGTTTLRLVASPGPDAIAASDPREASVFLTQVSARPVLNP